MRNMSKLNILPCLDSAKLAASRRQELDIPSSVAAWFGQSAVEAAHKGLYITEAGQEVEGHDAVKAACIAKLSIDPDTTLKSQTRNPFLETRVQVANETTLGASVRFV